MTSHSANLQALILAGGSGTRFWPLSRAGRPKQLLALDAEESLLRRTVRRLAPLVEGRDVWICTTAELEEAVRRECPEVPPRQVLCEPEGRDTAPAIGWAVRRMSARAGDALVAVLPADHRVEDAGAFRAALEAARIEVEQSDRVMTLGVVPRWAETGYGYLQLGQVVSTRSEARLVQRFTEKPSGEDAERFVASGDFLWNAGIFVFRAGRLTELLARFEPELSSLLDAIERAPERLSELYSRLPRISIDYAVMERAEGLGTLPLDCGWSDLGSWAALAEALSAGRDGNVVQGDVVSHDCTGNLLIAAEGLIAAVGVSDLVIVRTGDAVLVLPRTRSQDVREIVEELRASGRDDLL